MARSGRGYGRGGKHGRGGRGGRGNNNSNNNVKANKEKKFSPAKDNSNSNNFVSYQTVIEDIVRKVHTSIKHYAADVQETINELKRIDFEAQKPEKDELGRIEGKKVNVPKDPENPNAGLKEVIVTEFVFNSYEEGKLYSHALTKWQDRKESYEANLIKTTAIIYDKFCTKAMQERIDGELTSQAERQDLIVLLQTIRRIMYDEHRIQHPMTSLWSTSDGLQTGR